MVCRLLSSQFPLPSSGSSLMLFWSPSLPAVSCLDWILFLCVCCPCVLMSPIRWFLSRHLGFLFFLVSFSVSVSCPPWDSSLCCYSSTSFMTRSNLSSFVTGSSLWAESSLSVVAVVASLSVSSLGRLSPFVIGPLLLWLLPPLVSGPSGASGGCSSVPFLSEGSTLPSFLPWFPPDPPRASPFCVGSVERLPTPSVL